MQFLNATAGAGAGSGPALAVVDLGVDYGQLRALWDVSFTIGPGELVAVIGPNGAGKSTLFKAVCGLVAAEGNVRFGQAHCHHGAGPSGAAAYIPQRNDLDLDFPIRVDEVVLTGRRRFTSWWRPPGRRDRLVADAALAQVGLADLARRPIGALSGGQVQRVFLARALAQEARVLLLDEALSGVDEPSTAELLDLFRELTSAGATVLIATHDLALARHRFERCLAVNGTLVADGPPSVVLDGPALDATFGSARSTSLPQAAPGT